MSANGKRDYYEVLGVGKEAADQEIKSAYRKKAMEHHPDRNPDNHKEAEEKFKEAAEAYAVLSDPEKRSAYDRFGHAGLQGGSSFDPNAFSEFGDIFGNFGDLFGLGDLFGSGGRRSNRGSDLRYDLNLTFEEAAFGVKKKVRAPRMESCLDCGGTGAKKGSNPATCRTCGGRGQMRYQQGFFSVTRTCSACRGAGRVITAHCPHCRGEGRVRKEKILEVNVPAGVDTGTRLRIEGEGESGPRGGGPGDLYIVLRVGEHPIFERQDQHLHCVVPITVWQAALGDHITVPTLDGEEKLHVPEGTQSGTVFKLRGKGIPVVNAVGRGDLYITVKVIIPSKLTKEQRRLFEQLSDVTPADNDPAAKGVFDKVKDFFGG